MKQTIKEWVQENLDADKLKDVVNHGCVSGCVSDLIYYHDTVKFYDEHVEEIWEFLCEDASDQGFKNPMELIASFNGAEAVGSDYQFKNLLCWYSVERVCGELYNETEN